MTENWVPCDERVAVHPEACVCGGLAKVPPEGMVEAGAAALPRFVAGPGRNQVYARAALIAAARWEATDE